MVAPTLLPLALSALSLCATASANSHAELANVKGYVSQAWPSSHGCSESLYGKACPRTESVCSDGVSSQEYTGADCATATCSWGVHYNETDNVLGYFCRHKTSCTESKPVCDAWGLPQLDQPKSLFGWTCKTNINLALEEAASIAPQAGELLEPLKKEGSLLQQYIQKNTMRPGDWCPKTCKFCDEKAVMTIAFTSPEPSMTCTAEDFLGELCTSVFGAPSDKCPLTKVTLGKGDAVDRLTCNSQPSASLSGGRALATHVVECPDGGCRYEYEVEGTLPDLNNLEAAIRQEGGASSMDAAAWQEIGFGSVGKLNSSTTTTKIDRPEDPPGMTILTLIVLLVISVIYLLVVMPCAWAYWIGKCCCCYRCFLSREKRRALKEGRATRKRGLWTALACLLCLTPTCLCPVDVSYKVVDGVEMRVGP